MNAQIKRGADAEIPWRTGKNYGLSLGSLDDTLDHTLRACLPLLKS
jgi:hypothetical protein